MDPLSIAVAVSSLAIATARVSNSIHDIAGKANRANTTLTAISAECAIISSTLGQVEHLVKADPTAFSSKLTDAAHNDAGVPSLGDNLRNALESCDVTIVALSDTVDRCASKTGRTLLGKAKFLWNEAELTERLQTLRGLNQALTGLLSATQADSLTNVRRILSDNTAALETMVRRSRTYRKKYVPSILSGAEVTLFEFDDQVVDSPAYRRAFNSFQASTGSRTLVNDNETRREDASFVVVDHHKPEKKIEPQSPSSVPSSLPIREVATPQAAPDLSNPDQKALSEKLFAAVRDVKVDQVKSFCSQGADLSARNAQGLQPLHLAANNGSLEVVKVLVSYGANIEATTNDNDGMVPLHLACREQKTPVALYLIRTAGANIHVQDKHGNWPLNRAAIKGDLQVIKALLTAGADLECVGYLGWHPLHHAAGNLHVIATQLLLSKGADIAAEAENGDSPLHVAAEFNAAAVADLLISRGAELDAINHAGDQPLHKAVFKGMTVTIDLLLNKGADIEAFESKGGTALHVAAEQGTTAAAELLLARGARLDAINKSSNQPLNVAVAFGHFAIAQAMIEKGADIEARGAGGWSAIHQAARNNRPEILKYIISKGAVLDPRADEGDRPIHLSLRWHHLPCVKILVEAGADIEAKGQYNQAPLHIAAEISNTLTVEYLVSKGASVTSYMDNDQPLHRSARVDKAENARILIRAGANPTAVNKVDVQPMHLAAGLGHINVVKLLLEYGVPIDIEDVPVPSTSDSPQPPLVRCAGNGHPKCLEFMLSQKCNIELASANGDTALIVACWNVKVECVKLMLKAGANVNSKSDNGYSPMHCAVKKGSVEIARLLLETGRCDLGLRNADGKTAAEYADVEGKGEIGELLKGWKGSENGAGLIDL
ncbi:unnamed protein product [Cercospora beticola]|nr:unnamed protein product [Cercospora beticola]